MITIHAPERGQASMSEPILRALPDWFGIEEATRHYIQYTDDHPTFVAYEDEQAAGFLALREHSVYSAEIYVMAVRPERHGRGIGRALVEAAEGHLRERGFEYLQVKTLADSHPDEGYRATRAFYQRMGFRPLEVFPTLWNPSNPCLQMIKRI
ncbi:MAG: GNAT family N-acetyltransferase [Anaerolineae bacterium]